MPSDNQTAPVGKASLWAGRVVSAIPSLFLLMDGVMKLIKPEIVVKKTVELGFPEGGIFGLGILLLACLAVYVIPRTAILGAILLTGYLGGAVATHVRAGDDLFPVIFPVLVGAPLWGGLYLRDGRVRALVPIRS
jgi:hypothetical protein